MSPLELVELELLELLEELELLELELLELELLELEPLELELSVDVCPPQASRDTTVQKSKIRFIDPPAHRMADAFIILAIYIPLKLPAIETEKGLRRVKRCNPSANNEFVTLSPFRFDKLNDHEY